MPQSTIFTKLIDCSHREMIWGKNEPFILKSMQWWQALTTMQIEMNKKKKKTNVNGTCFSRLKFNTIDTKSWISHDDTAIKWQRSHAYFIPVWITVIKHILTSILNYMGWCLQMCALLFKLMMIFQFTSESFNCNDKHCS